MLFFRKSIFLTFLFFAISHLKSQTVVVAGYTINNIPVTNTVQQIAVDNAGKRILLSGPSLTGKLDIFDINTNTTYTISSTWASNIINCSYPYVSTDVEYYNGYMYSCIPSTVSARDSIVKTNLATGVSSIISTPSMPSGLTGIEGGAAFAGNKFFFTSPNASSSLYALDLNSQQILNYTVNVPLNSYHTLEYNPVDDRLYLSVSDALYKVNLITSTLTSIGNLNSATFSQFALDPNGLFAWTQNGSSVYKMSLATGISTAIVNSMGGGTYQDLEFGPSTGSCNAIGASLYIGKNASLVELKGFANTISALSINNLTYCQGSTFKLPYLAIGNYCAGNIFTAQLSNAAGSFAAPLSIGTKTTNSGADTLMCTIPGTLSAGTGYKVRLISSSPAITGFSSAMTLTVLALAAPVVSVNSGSTCAGQSFTMVPSGAVSYSFSGGSAVVNPGVTTSYSVIGTNSAGCVSPVPAISNVTVNPAPVITVNSGTICSGNSFTISPGGAATYTISGGSAVVTPTATASYTVSGTDSLGCVSALSATAHVIVDSLPAISAITNKSVMCLGEDAILSANGANTYTWLPSGSGPNILISPSVTTTYTVYGTAANGCTNTANVTQSVASCAGIKENANSNEQVLFSPNPFNFAFSIELISKAVPQNSQIIIFNALGSIVKTLRIENTKTEVDLRNESSGLYFLKIIMPATSINMKIIKE